MIKFKQFLFLLVLFPAIVFAQDNKAEKDSINLYEWTPAAVVGINLSQLALSNWSQGGDNALTWTFVGTGGLRYYTTAWRFRNNLKITYGRTKLGGSDFRTNDNEFYLESVISKTIDWPLDPYFSNTIRTTVAKGYNYDVDPPVETANFFDPGYVTQSLGMMYEHSKTFNTRLGVAIQEVFTNKHTQYSDDTTTAEIEKFKFETGVESVTNAEFTLAKNLLAKSTLRLFSRFESMDVWDVRWDNTIAAKINDFLNVNLSVLLIYEKQQSLKTQVKESLQLGFVYTLL